MKILSSNLSVQHAKLINSLQYLIISLSKIKTSHNTQMFCITFVKWFLQANTVMTKRWF